MLPAVRIRGGCLPYHEAGVFVASREDEEGIQDVSRGVSCRERT